MERAVAWSVMMGTKVLLWKLMARPVVAKKSSRTFLRFATCLGTVRMMIRVSSAY
jgi:hypothetical protein